MLLKRAGWGVYSGQGTYGAADGTDIKTTNTQRTMSRTKQNNQRDLLSLRDTEIKERVKKLSEESGRTESWYIYHALKKALPAFEKQHDAEKKAVAKLME